MLGTDLFNLAATLVHLAKVWCTREGPMGTASATPLRGSTLAQGRAVDKAERAGLVSRGRAVGALEDVLENVQCTGIYLTFATVRPGVSTPLPVRSGLTGHGRP